jgi:butyryl-CoA dehydrogenase
VRAARGRRRAAQLHAIGARLREGSKSLADSVRWILATGMQDLNAVLAGAVPFLHLCGVVCGGWQMGRAALAAQRKLAAGDGDAAFYRAKIATARFFADQDCRGRAGSPRRPCTPAPARWRSPKNSSDLGALP